MKYWRTDPYAWAKANPYRGPYSSAEEAERWCESIRRVHTDTFRVIKTESGFAVEQDIPNGPKRKNDDLRSHP